MLRDHRRLAAALIGVVVSADALACRCAPRSMDAYFADAAEVFIATVAHLQTGGSETVVTLDDPARWYKGSRSVEYRTASNSAACGISPAPGSLLVGFAAADPARPGVSLLDSCSGSRTLGTDDLGAEPFPGLPGKFLVSRLLALEGLERLRLVAVSEPQPGSGSMTAFRGLVELPDTAEVSFHAVPGGQPYRPLLTAELVTREIAYEEPALEVHGVAEGWFRVVTHGGEYGWVPAVEVGTFHAYDHLPVGRLAYLERGWGGLLWPAPGAGQPFAVAAKAFGGYRERPAEVIEAQRIGGSLWFRVRLPDVDPCATAGASGPATVGWLPGYGTRGQPVVWFHSRGC